MKCFGRALVPLELNKPEVTPRELWVGKGRETVNAGVDSVRIGPRPSLLNITPCHAAAECPLPTPCGTQA